MSRTLWIAASAGLLITAGCNHPQQDQAGPPASYYDNKAHPGAWSGGARKITISTPKGPHQLWIKRVGNNPKLKLLLLTGGPGFSHGYLEVMDSFLPAEGVEYYHYDQLETGESQVRKTIDGTKDNFCLLGHSWGGLLAIEYALAHQDQLKSGDLQHGGLDPGL